MLKKEDMSFGFIKFFSPENARSLYLLISTTLLIYRLVLAQTYFHLVHVLMINCISFQILFLIFGKKTEQFFKKKYYIINLFSLINHINGIYLVPQSGLRFFLGVEISIIVYLNFSEIKNLILRILIVGFSLVLFLKKENDFEIDFPNLIYFLYLLFIMNLKLKKNMDFKDIRTDSTKIIEDEEKTSSTKIKKDVSAKISFKKTNSLRKPRELTNRRTILVNPFADQKLLALNMINILNIGILVIDQDFKLVYANACLFDFFKSKDLDQVKKTLFDIKENLEFNQSDFNNIPDFALQKIFHNSLQVPESFRIFEDPCLNESNEHKKYYGSKLSSLNKNKITHSSIGSNEENLIQFRSWRKKNLMENLPEKVLKKNENQLKSRTVFNYLIRLINYCKKNSSLKQNYSNGNLSIRSLPEIEKYSMYANIKIDKNERNFEDENEYPILINFIPLRKDDSAAECEWKTEIMITIRKLSDLELSCVSNAASKNKILGSFCHELRTPINGLLNMLDLMQTQMNDFFTDKEYYILSDYLSNALVSGHLLLNEIDDFIDYFAFCNDMLEVNSSLFNLHELIKDVHKVFYNISIKKFLNFTLDIDPNIPSCIQNDHKKIKQILFNLLNNSIRFTNTGIIKISAKLLKNDLIEISVLDTGCGIKQENLGLLGCLDSSQENNNRTTSGFGLFISNVLCQLLEAYKENENQGLTVYSEYGKGSCFVFLVRTKYNPEKNKNISQKIELSSERLVVSKSSHSFSIEINEKKKGLKSMESLIDGMERKKNRDKKANISCNQSEAEIISNRSIITKTQFVEKNSFRPKFLGNALNSKPKLKCDCDKILIVDDGPFNIEVCRSLIAKFNIKCDYANNGLEAIIKVQTALEKKNNKFCELCNFYKLILMDIDMPIKNGLEVTAEIKNLLKSFNYSVEIIGLSAFHQEEIKRRGIEAGMREYIVKPINSNQIKELINKYV